MFLDIHTLLTWTCVYLPVLNSPNYKYLAMLSFLFMYTYSAYYAMLEETKEIVDKMELTAGTTCTWKDMWHAVIFADNIESLVRSYAH